MLLAGLNTLLHNSKIGFDSRLESSDNVLIGLIVAVHIRARMHEPGVSATPGLKSSYAGLACKVGMHDIVVTLLVAQVPS